MAFLTPDKTRTEHGLVIKQKLIPDGSHLKPNRPLLHGSVEWITIHNTDRVSVNGTTQSEQYSRATHNGNMGGVSVHYYIDNADCWQLLREDEMGYHAADGNTGPGNGTSLAIEIIMSGTTGAANSKAEDRGALLAAILLNRHGLGIEKLTTHRHWYPAKYCPAYILPHWQTFVSKVSAYLAQIKAQAKKGPVYRVQVGAFTNKANAEAMQKKLKAAGYDAIIRLDGDLDGDGQVTPADARKALRMSLGMED